MDHPLHGVSRINNNRSSQSTLSVSGRWSRQQGRPREQGQLQVFESKHGVQRRRQADSVAEIPDRRLSLGGGGRGGVDEVISLEEISYYMAHYYPASSYRIFCTFFSLSLKLSSENRVGN